MRLLVGTCSMVAVVAAFAVVAANGQRAPAVVLALFVGVLAPAALVLSAAWCLAHLVELSSTRTELELASALNPGDTGPSA